MQSYINISHPNFDMYHLWAKFILCAFRLLTFHLPGVPYYITISSLCQIRSLFGEHGNIVEVVILKDKRTGQQLGMSNAAIFQLNFYLLAFLLGILSSACRNTRLSILLDDLKMAPFGILSWKLVEHFETWMINRLWLLPHTALVELFSMGG